MSDENQLDESQLSQSPDDIENDDAETTEQLEAELKEAKEDEAKLAAGSEENEISPSPPTASSTPAPIPASAAATSSSTTVAVAEKRASGKGLPAGSAASSTSVDSAAEIAKRIAIQAKRREEELQRQKMEEEKEFPPGFHYRDDSEELCRYLKPFELQKEYINLHCSFGYAAQKRYNIHYIDFGVLLFATGNTVQILDLFQDHHQDHRKKTVLLGHGRDSNVGIGAIAVHPSKTYFAVAEKGNNPNIYIYNYPNKEIVRILSRGTEKAYADIQFSHTGTKLVSVGQEPDFLLTVWDWARERVILRTKAFSQEVFRVAFSPVNEGRLLTSGTGHIRFWKMAKTFTGLKLQGMIGKFGQVELSDISAFVELPDGKVLSGTESGNLLMWDGNFIQYQVMKQGPLGTTADRKPCHDGMIEFITLDEREIVTAGADGYVRKWKFDKLEFAEASEEDPIIALEPIVEIKIGQNVQIRGMLKGDDHWIIQDYNGGLYKLWLANYEVQKLLDVHSGKINAMISAPLRSHIAVTAGQDHSIRCWDVLNGEQLYQRSFNSPATSLLWAPNTVDEEHRIILVGFADGVVRIVKRYKDSFKLHHVFKPHTTPVIQMAISPDGLMLATGAEDGSVFFLSIGFKSKCANLIPLGFVKLASKPLSLNWSADSMKLLLASGPDVLEFTRPNAELYTDPIKMAARDTYEIELEHRIYRCIIRDTRPVDQQEEDDLAEAKAAEMIANGAVIGGPDIAEDGSLRVRDPPKPKPIIGLDLIYDVSACIYHPTDPNTFFLTLDGGGSREDPNYFPGQPIETLYECSFTPPADSAIVQQSSTPATPAQGTNVQAEPLRSVYLGRHIGTVNILNYSLSKKYLLLGTKNGGIQLRALSDLSYFFYTHYHDGSGNSVSGHGSYLAKDRIGLVTSVATTFDDRFLLSTGNDGNFFAHSIDPISALAHMDRSIELKIAAEKRAAEEARLNALKIKEEAKEARRKEEEERAIKEAQQQAAQAKGKESAAKTRETKEREAREAKERELREKEAKEKHDREREARLRAREASKGDKERDDENWDHLSTKIPAQSFTKLPLPDPATSQERLELRKHGSTLEEDTLDIVDPKTYSIEEAKLKQEEDDRVAAAEKKKHRLRLEIGELRKEFVHLLRKNASLEPGQQLPRDAFELDPKLRSELEAEAQKKIDEVRAELAWISEKHSLALQKLRAKFLDQLLVEHISLKAFHSGGISVTCFRTPELPPFLRTAIEGVHRLMESEENLRTQQEQQLALASASGSGNGSDDDLNLNSSLGATGGLLNRGGLRGTLRARAGSASSGPGGALVPRRPAGSGVSEAELRKQARLERSIQLTKLKQAKPDKNVDDPADVAAVQYAEKHMGDYKLKSDPNYIVPEHQRVNAERKRRQMVLLQESVHYIKMALNERFLALRDLKARIIKNIKKDNVRLRELNSKLGITEILYEPELDPSEWPEHRELFTREDLIQFETEREKERVRAVNVGSRSIFSSALGSFDDEEGTAAATGASGSGNEKKDDKTAAGASKDKSDKSAKPSTITEESLSPSQSPPLDEDENRTEVESALKREEDRRQTEHDQRVNASLQSSTSSSASASSTARRGPLSSMERTEDEIQRKLWEHERRTLLEKIHYAIWSFDNAIAKLRREKFKLDSDLKTTDLKILTLYQELYLLKDFEENENRLFAKLTKARANKAQVVSEMTDCEKQLSHKLSEIKLWQEKDKQVMQDFNIVVGGEKSEFYTQLLKIFKKKVKRNKKKAGGAGGGRAAGGADGDEGGEDGDDSDLDMTSSDSDSGSESDSDESDDDSCPLHLDSAIYEKVLELREKRLEQEEILADFNKNVAELNKTYERLGGRERLIDKELSSTEADIEAFQSEKQRALNLIDVSIPLKLNQMKYLQQDGRLPKDISHSLIFTSTGLSKLKNRILELQQEKLSLTRQFKELKKQHRVLLKELSVKREEIAVEKKKCEDVQMLKFGQIIDLNILEKVGVDEGASELRSKLKSLEVSSVHKVSEWDQKIEEGKNELARITEQNTRWLDKVAKLTKAQYDLEDTLNNTTKNVHVADSSPLDDQSDLERRQLLELVQLQEREIDALKAEIHVLRRKGGHVYTPQA